MEAVTGPDWEEPGEQEKINWEGPTKSQPGKARGRGGDFITAVPLGLHLRASWLWSLGTLSCT